MIECPFTPEQLQQYYCKEWASIEKIGQYAEFRIGKPVSSDTARRWLTEAGIPIRAYRENKESKCPTCKHRKSCETVMCNGCWELLPLALQMEIWEIFTKEGRSERFFTALKPAIEIVLSGKKGAKSQFKDAPSGKYGQLSASSHV